MSKKTPKRTAPTRPKARKGFYYREIDGGKLRYVAEHETPRFLSEGVWLVHDRTNCHSESLISKIGELPSPYPYANMAMDIDDLATFICHWKNKKAKETSVLNNDGSVTFTIGSAAEQAQAILKFLAMNATQREVEKKRVVSENLYLSKCVISGNWEVRDGYAGFVRWATDDDMKMLTKG